MITINGISRKVAIKWDSIEDISFDLSELPDQQLRITKKSGGVITVLNPHDSVGMINFEVLVLMWIDRSESLTINENNSNKHPECGPPMLNFGGTYT